MLIHTQRNRYPAPSTLTHHRRRAGGFTLIEVMVVVVILSILAAMVVPKLMDKPEKARIARAQADVNALVSALNLYRLDNMVYPSTDQGLEALVTKPSSPPEPKNWSPDGYLPQVPIDPWGNPYLFLNPGSHGAIDVYSTGSDLQTAEDDIGNWNLK